VIFSNDNTQEGKPIKLDWDDKNNDGAVQKNEITSKAPYKLSAKQWKTVVNLIQINLGTDETKVTAKKPTESTTTKSTAFNKLVKENFGIDSSDLEMTARNNLSQLKAQADALAKKIDPNSPNWQDTLTGLDKQRFGTAEEAVNNYKKTSAETLSYLKEKGWVPESTKPVDVVEDKTNEGYGAYVSEDDGKFYVETKDKKADIYLPFDAKSGAVHELIHAVDFQKGGLANNPLKEGLAYHIEEQAYKKGDYYKTDAEKLQALKWQIIRNERVIKTAELQTGKTTPEKAKQDLMKQLKISDVQADSEVTRILDTNSKFK
jgi:hypothetical protein